jgi:predicted phage baseplate assembly protein
MSLESERGRIVPPDLDDRSWQDLVDEMRALIPHYAPAWTDHNPGDIGISLIELFAWLAEGVIYRLNRVPEKNYLAFLNLLGVTRNPPTPAYTYLTFTAGAKKVDVPAGTQAQTPASEDETPVVFETDEDVTVLPVNLASAVLVGPYPPNPTSATYQEVPVVGPPAAKFAISVPARQNMQLCLGFDRASAAEIKLGVRLYRPATDTDQLTVSWVYSRGTDGPPAWQPIPTRTDATESLRHDGNVSLTVPANWAEQRPTAPAPNERAPAHPDAPVWSRMSTQGRPVTDARFWIGMRVANTSAAAVDIGVDRIVFNSALAHTALTIRSPEIVGQSTGEAFQTFALQHRPLFRQADLRAPYGHLVVQVSQGVPTDGVPGSPASTRRVRSTQLVWETWSLVDDLPPGPGKVYRLNPVTGEISFGDHDERTNEGRGSVPPPGSMIQAASYRYVGAGAVGNVAHGQVTAAGTTRAGALPTAVAAVVNLGPGLDGSDEEPIDDALRRAPEELKIRDRAVTADDYEFLSREATNDVVITRCLPPRLQGAVGDPQPRPWEFAGINRAPGVVNLIIVPDQGKDIPRPEPTPDLIRDVQRYLDQRRDLTARLAVYGPIYLPIIVKAELLIWPQAVAAGVDEEAIKTETLSRIAAFLHPTHGGPDGTGWQVGQHVFSSDLFRAIMPSEDVGYISNLQVKPGTPAYFPAGGDADIDSARPFPLSDFGASVRVADYELVCAADSTEHLTVTTALV